MRYEGLGVKMIRNFLLLLAAISAGQSFAHTLQYVTDDLVVIDGQTEMRKPSAASLLDEDCREKIQETVCVVGGSTGGDRPCAPESSDYVPLFQRIHDRLPEVLQKMFCKVERIYVEKNIPSTAYASPWSSAIGMRKSLLDEKLTFAHWATWKEQLTFGGKLDSYLVDEALPTFVSNGTHEDFVMNVVIHEFVHLFDFANDLNETEGFKFKAGSWGEIGWKSNGLPLPSFDFADRKSICFYDCGTSPVAKTKVTAIYNDVYTKTNFLNTYTSRNPREDFADTFAFYYTYELSPDLSYVLETRQGASYDFKQELNSTRLAKKLDYIKGFVGKADLLYP